jgi:integrase/recombinase XerD
MTPLRQRMREDMQLCRFAPRTQGVYIHAVALFARYYHKSPEHITDEEIRRYFVYLINEKQVSPSTVSVTMCAIKFLYTHTLQRPYPSLTSSGARTRGPCPLCSVSTRSVSS